MDSLTQPETATTARDAAVALIALLDLVGDEPEFASLCDETYWFFRGRSGELSGRFYNAYGSKLSEGSQVLELWRQRLGGEVQPTTEKYTDNSVYYELKTEIGGVPVSLKVPVEKPDVEQQLRDRIAELEAALDGGAEDGEGQ